MKKKATVETCDNPECGTIEIVGDEVVFGYHLGKGYWASGLGGGPVRATFACSEECILPAVLASSKPLEDLHR